MSRASGGRVSVFARSAEHWNGRRTQAASALSTESLAHLALPRLVGDRAVVDRLSG